VVWNLPGGANAADYQDHNPPDADTNPDRYVVFHFHTEHLAMIDGVQRPGIYAIVAFHGQDYGGGRVPRIDGNNEGGRNNRAAVMNCNTGSDVTPETYYWYPGSNEQRRSSTHLAAFGNYMVDNGLLDANTFIGGTSGQLQLQPADSSRCNIQKFDWGRWRQSQQFGPNGSAPPRGGGGSGQNAARVTKMIMMARR